MSIKIVSMEKNKKRRQAFFTKGIKFVKTKINDRTTHNKLGEKIYTAFNNELAESDVGVGEIDEECENKEA